MQRNGRKSNHGKVHWVCAVKRNAWARKQYDALSGVAYSRKLLLGRRWLAVHRRKRGGEP